jgi:glycosyltransferase involved in cell wall biosynthesis
MDIKIQQFLFQNHSWAIVGWNISRSLLKMGHSVELFATDTNKTRHLPQDLAPYLSSQQFPQLSYDCQIGYTAPVNWGAYFQNGNKNRFAIWNYEYRGSNLLPGFAKYYKMVDKVLPSSNFSKDVFLDMGVPEQNLIVVPHGINLEDFENKNKYPLKTKKNIKILLNIAQPHKRKAIHLALKAFGEAFKKTDDVCLVAKISVANKSDHQFSVDFHKIYNEFCRQYNNHAEVEIITSFIPNIAELYNACDINFSATHTECWHLPSLEALAAGLINVVPKYGGILDFCNEENSLLIDGKIARAPRDHQYWLFSPYAQHFEIDIDDAVKKLKMAVENNQTLKNKMLPAMIETAKKYTWESATSKIMELCT